MLGRKFRMSCSDDFPPFFVADFRCLAYSGVFYKAKIEGDEVENRAKSVKKRGFQQTKN